MKILRHGTLPKNILFTGDCTNCCAQVEASYSEVTRRNLGDRYSGEFIESFVLCPTQGCGRRIIMFERPSKIQKQCFDKLNQPRQVNKDLQLLNELFSQLDPTPRKESVKLKLPSRPNKRESKDTLNDLFDKLFEE